MQRAIPEIVKNYDGFAEFYKGTCGSFCGCCGAAIVQDHTNPVPNGFGRQIQASNHSRGQTPAFLEQIEKNVRPGKGVKFFLIQDKDSDRDLLLSWQDAEVEALMFPTAVKVGVPS
jgi:hypothetical protein